MQEHQKCRLELEQDSAQKDWAGSDQSLQVQVRALRQTRETSYCLPFQMSSSEPQYFQTLQQLVQEPKFPCPHTLTGLAPRYHDCLASSQQSVILRGSDLGTAAWLRSTAN